MKNKRIGILTYYYESINYGGVLQSYALPRVLKKLGYVSEQICYTKEKEPIRNYNLFRLLKLLIKKCIYYFLNIKLKDRYNKFKIFRKSVPHSSLIYTDKNIDKSLKYYDIFITGSDQVWNLTWYCPAFFLNFVPLGTKKLSYGASLGRTKLSSEEKSFFRKNLVNYSAISVRELDAVNLLESEINIKIEHVLDPTLLLTKEEWDEICSERLVKGKYLFCYFIGDNSEIRKIAKKYAKIHNLKLVVLPHAMGFTFSDCFWGDLKMYDIGPSEFISLIKYADYIMTDSFHGCVFSCIYKKQFNVFQRSNKKNMSSRIYSLLSLYNVKERFCDSVEKQDINYIETLSEIKYEKNIEFDTLYDKSIKYLQKNLK